MKTTSPVIIIVVVTTFYFLLIFLLMKWKMNFTAKYIISAALIIENPVRSPMVPPIADNMSTNFAALSLVILLKVGVSK